MCTLIALQRPGAAWPVLLAANRDERLDREARALGRHWPGKPWRGGLDVSGGGTWAGVHDRGFAVLLLNRERSLGPAPGKRSRGLLALDLLEAGDAGAAEADASRIAAGTYRPFLSVIASGRGVAHALGGDEPTLVEPISDRTAVWTASGLNTDRSPRQRSHRAAIDDVAARWTGESDPAGMIDALQSLLSRPAPPEETPAAALCVHWPEMVFGTRSSLVVAFGAAGDTRVWFADGPPDATPLVEAIE